MINVHVKNSQKLNIYIYKIHTQVHVHYFTCILSVHTRTNTDQKMQERQIINLYIYCTIYTRSLSLKYFDIIYTYVLLKQLVA